MLSKPLHYGNIILLLPQTLIFRVDRLRCIPLPQITNQFLKFEFYNLGTLIGTDYSASYSTVYRFVYGCQCKYISKQFTYDNCGDHSSSIITIDVMVDGYRNINETGKIVVVHALTPVGYLKP